MNPVLRKDLLGLLRLKRVAAIQVLFVATLAAMVMFTWPQGGILSVAAQGKDQLLMGLVIGQLVLLVLFVPGIAAVALTGEKEQNTLEMLYASRLTPSQIIWGKILGSISFPILLLVSGLPFLALLHWRGAVDAPKLGWAYVILVLAAVMLAMVSLTISALCKQSATALVFAYVGVLVVCGGTLVPAAIMLEGQSGLPARVLHYGRSLSPVAAALSLLRPGVTDLGGEMHQLLSSWRVFVPAAVAIILGCFAVLVAVLRRPPVSPDAFGAPIGGNEDERTFGRKVMYLIDPRKKRKPFGSRNPLIAKEARTNNLRSGRWMIRTFY
ncbi:MAG: ABC transporter permease, partial [Tepidisphaeraceae bacterium]